MSITITNAPIGEGYPVSRAHLVPDGNFEGTVHSVFATSCNLQVGDLLVVVHDAAKPHTPTSIRVAAAQPWSPVTRTGDRVTYRAGMLTFGRHVLPLSRLPVWRPTPRRWALSLGTVHRQSTRLAAVVESRATYNGIPVDPQLVDGVRRLRTLIATTTQGQVGSGPPTSTAAAAGAMDRAVRQLVGLGGGLTPAGDDALVGLLAVLHRRHGTPGIDRAIVGLGNAITGQIHRTTDISAHYLRLAIQGHVGEALDGLLDAVDSDAPSPKLAARTAEVLNLGATSGADTVRGVLAGLHALTDIPHAHHLQETAA